VDTFVLYLQLVSASILEVVSVLCLHPGHSTSSVVPPPFLSWEIALALRICLDASGMLRKKNAADALQLFCHQLTLFFADRLKAKAESVPMIAHAPPSSFSN
jgi:hypothetical protein